MKWRRTLLQAESAFCYVKWLETLKESATVWQWRIILDYTDSGVPLKGIMYKSEGKYRIPVVYEDKEIGIAVGKNQTECVRQYFSIIETYEIQKHNDLIDQIFDRKLV
jgi:hypothetical protein